MVLASPACLDPAWGPLFLLFAMPPMALGFACFYWLAAEYRRAGRRVHAVTNARVMTVTSKGPMRVTSHGIGSVARVTYRDRGNGTGTFLLDLGGKSSNGEGGYTNEEETWRGVLSVRGAEAAVREFRWRERGEQRS